MVLTRRATKAGVMTADALSTFNYDTQAAPYIMPKLLETISRSRKRKTNTQQEQHSQPGTSKRRTAGSRAPIPKDSTIKSASISTKPRLARPDLEFEYDRSKLRDPRPTPGRKIKPCYDEMDIPDDLLARLKKTRDTVKAKERKGRLNVVQQLEFDAEKALSNPLEFSHDLYKCHAKGRAGSPTYDSAGFELDFDKVCAGIFAEINGVYDSEEEEEEHERYEEMLDEEEREEKELLKTFLVDPDKVYKGKVTPMEVENYIKDHVSKDLGVPWHQINLQRIKDWRRKGFERVKFDTWWKTPAEEEDKRMLKMMDGSKYRKDM